MDRPVVSHYHYLIFKTQYTWSFVQELGLSRWWRQNLKPDRSSWRSPRCWWEADFSTPLPNPHSGEPSIPGVKQMFRGLASPQRLYQQPRRDVIREGSSSPPMGHRVLTITHHQGSSRITNHHNTSLPGGWQPMSLGCEGRASLPTASSECPRCVLLTHCGAPGAADSRGPALAPRPYQGFKALPSHLLPTVPGFGCGRRQEGTRQG